MAKIVRNNALIFIFVVFNMDQRENSHSSMCAAKGGLILDQMENMTHLMDKKKHADYLSLTNLILTLFILQCLNMTRFTTTLLVIIKQDLADWASKRLFL